MEFLITLQPTTAYRRAFKEGMNGSDVAAFQIGLNSHRRMSELKIDGAFGLQTKRVVLDEQKRHSLVEDGIAGIVTQRTLALMEGREAEVSFEAPRDLMKGLIEGESGWAWAAATGLYGNGTRDLGAIQRNTIMTDQNAVREAFMIREQIRRSCRDIKAQHDLYVGDPGIRTDRAAWENAVLFHNWQAAATQIALGKFDVWRYISRKIEYGVDDPAPWIIEIGVPNVETGRQWVRHYIQSKTIYINW